MIPAAFAPRTAEDFFNCNTFMSFSTEFFRDFSWIFFIIHGNVSDITPQAPPVKPLAIPSEILPRVSSRCFNGIPPEAPRVHPPEISAGIPQAILPEVFSTILVRTAPKILTVILQKY